MLSSWQIAQMHGQQQQSFSAQQAYSQQLSTGMPQPYSGGLGQPGIGGGFGSGGGYNYGGGMSGYGPGNAFGNSMTSMIGGVGRAAFGTTGMAMTGGMMGMKMGGLGGGMLGAGLGMGIGMVGQHFFGSMMQGGQEQSAVERTLSQFQFQNAGSRSGRGFSRSDSMAIGNMVRQMERMPEMLTSFGELNRLMDKMGQMGLMQGTRDVGEFMRKFKDTTNTLRDMAKMMGTTMESALQAFGESRLAGFYSKNDIMKNVMSARVTGALTGMGTQQVLQMQQYGGEMAHSLGGSRRGGAQFMNRTAAQFGMMNQMGILSNDQIMEMTGKEGAAGIQDMSVQMSQLGYKMGQSNVGTALTLALGETKEGRYTGKMDQALVEKVRRGEISINEIKALARQKAETRGSKLSFAAHRQRLTTEMTGAVGTEGIAMQLQEILGERGWQNPDATNLVMQRFGANEEQANLLQQMMPNLANVQQELKSQAAGEGRRSAIQSVQREQYSLDAIKHKIVAKIKHYTTDWIKDIGVGVRDYFQEVADDFVDDLTGQYRTEVTKDFANTLKGAAGGSKSARGELAARLSLSRNTLQRGGDLTGGGPLSLAGIARGLGGGSTAGSDLYQNLRDADPTALTTVENTWKNRYSQDMSPSGMREKGFTHLTQGFGANTYVNAEGVKKAAAGLTNTMSSQDLKNKMGSESYDKLINIAQAAYRDPDVMNAENHTERARKIAEWMMTNAPIEYGTAVSVAGSKDKLLLSLQKDEKLTGYVGRVSAEGLTAGLTGNDLTDLGGKAKKREKLGKELAKMEGGVEMKKMIDEDGAFRGIMLAPDEDKEKIEDLLARDPSSWKDSDREVLKRNRIDPEDLAKNKDKIRTMRNAFNQMSPEATDKVLKYINAHNAEDLLGSQKLLNAQGDAIAGLLAGGSLNNVKSKEGAAALTQLGAVGQALSGDALDKISKGAGPDFGAFAQSLSGIKDENEKNLILGAANDRGITGAGAAVSMYDRVKKAGTGKSLDETLKSAGITKEQLGSDEYASLQERFKGGVKDDALAKELANVAGVGNIVKPGATQGSTQVSEEKIADALLKMQGNNEKMAGILANIAAGKPANADLPSKPA